MRVLIAGCGYVGSELGRRLAAAGHEAYGLRRDPSSLPASIRPVAADLGDAGALRAALDAALPTGFDAVVYAAAADGFDEARYRAAYVDGPRRLLDALLARGATVRRFVFVSSTGVYAQQDGSWVDEDTPAEPPEFSGRALRDGERAVLAGPYPATVLRLGGIYGPGRTRLVDAVRTGAARAREGLFTNRIHRDDAAGALAHLLGLDAPAPLYLGVDDEPAEEPVILDWLADRLGVPRPPRDAAAPRDGLERRGNKRCRNARLRAAGYAFHFPTFREGFAALLGRP